MRSSPDCHVVVEITEEDLVHQEVPSPFNVSPSTHTPVIAPTNFNIDPRQLLQQQENFKIFLEQQKSQFLATIQQQHETNKNAQKQQEIFTNLLIEMIKKQTL